MSEVKWIVLHDEEAPTARSAAAWFQNPASGGSAHLCIDNTIAYRTVADDVIAEGAANANTEGLHIEHAGYARFSKVVWTVANSLSLHRSAYKAARWCKKYNIPANFVDAAGLARGEKGITTHAQVSIWSATHNLPGDHSHTDPGSHFPVYLYCLMVRAYLKLMK